jgi:sugar/nucleoside kinase (ribokinase family)
VTRPRVAGVGDVMLDVVVRARTAIAPTSDTPADTVVGRGGAAANLAVALAAAGCAVTFIGAGGGDGPAALVEAALVAGGVEARIERVPGATGTVVALVGPDGQRAMLTDRGANGGLTGDFLDHHVPCDASHLHVSGYTVLDPRTREVARGALRTARAAGITTSVDVCSVAPLRAVGRAAFLETTALAGWLFANAEEAVELADDPDEEGALAALATQYREVLVTLGVRGALARRGELQAAASAPRVEVVDTTGAGDAASGAYLAARLTGADLAGALAAAMEAAGRVVGALGASPYSRE